MEKKIRIKDLIINYRIIYRPIKNPRIEFKTGELLLIVSPEYKKPESLIEKHSEWIYRNIRKIHLALDFSSERELNMKRTEEEFKRLVRNYGRNASKQFNVEINQIFFRNMVSKWASCSKRRNFTVNKLCRYLPEIYIKYIIYHECVHLLEKKHNGRFWNILAKYFPQCQLLEKGLLDYWLLIYEEKRIPLEKISVKGS